jgi:phasin
VSEGEVKVGNGNGFDVSVFGFPKPGAFGQLTEQGVARAQESCDKIKAASGEMADALREAYSSNSRIATDYGLKVIEISNANAASTIDFVAELLRSKSMTDVFSLSAAHARKTFETASAQNTELLGLVQKLATETGEPIRKRVAKVLHQAN